jgi:hypothetical protein
MWMGMNLSIAMNIIRAPAGRRAAHHALPRFGIGSEVAMTIAARPPARLEGRCGFDGDQTSIDDVFLDEYLTRRARLADTDT